MISAANGSTVANYEYDPFGELIRASGPMAKLNPIRFSTKYQDDESDLLYHGYRFYNPSTGRWLNRDPLGDDAFLRDYIGSHRQLDANKLSHESTMPLYLFDRNDPVDRVDHFGLSSEPDVSWSPASCPLGQITAFIQVVWNYNWASGVHVDNGSYGPKSSKSTGCPLYPLPPNMNQVFQDSPSGWTGTVMFTVCRVCLKPCACSPGVTPSYKIVSVGPCVSWKKGDKGDLGGGNFTVVNGPTQTWQVGMDTDFPAAAAGKCFVCSQH